MRGRDSFWGKFSWTKEYKAEREERHPERLTQGHAELCCGGAEFQREIEILLRNSQDLVSELACETERPES